jgi:hypothetical protein
MTLNTMLNRSHLQIAAILTLKFMILTNVFMLNVLGDVGDVATSYKLHCFHSMVEAFLFYTMGI